MKKNLLLPAYLLVTFFLFFSSCNNINDAVLTQKTCMERCDEMEMECDDDDDCRQCKQKALTEYITAINQCEQGKQKPWNTCSEKVLVEYNSKVDKCTKDWLEKAKACRDACRDEFSKTIGM